MNKDFVPYKEALILKNLGLDISCFGFYNNADGNIWVKHEIDPEIKDIYKGDFEAPTYQQSFDWFEDEHSIFIDRKTYTNVNEIMNIEYSIKSWKFPPIKIEFENPYDCFDRDKARLECLKKLIEVTK